VSADSSQRVSSVPWFDGTAPLLLAPAHSNDRALVVSADSLAPDLEDGALQQPGTLVRLDGSLSSVRVSLSSGSEGCVDAVLEPAPAAAWGVGFVGKAPTGIHIDSIRAISRQDSIALTPMIFRLASSVPNTPGGRFAGLPFSLADLWRIKTAEGATIVVATTKRHINQEDSPLEERTLLIAETDASGNFSRVYSARSAGPEAPLPDMNTSVAFYGVIYTPYGDFTVASNNAIYGALVARNVTFSGSAPVVHFDTDLRNQVFSGVDTPYAVSDWRDSTDGN